MKDILIQAFKSFRLHFKEHLQVELLLSKKELFEALVKKINSEIVGKIEQDVEILEIDLVSENALNVKGKAGVMGIKKEFVVHSFLEVNQVEDVIKLRVKDIVVEGGFLVQKGFSLIENKLKEKIESTAKIDLKKTITSLNPSFPIPGSSEKLQLSINAFDLETLSLMPKEGDILATVAVREAGVLLNPIKIEL